MLADMLNRPCTITRRVDEGDTDEYGNPMATLHDLETVCELQQQTRGENDEDISATTWRLILPAGTHVSTRDTITVDGEEFEVTGDPWPARNPRTRVVSHIEATVERRAGAGDPGSPS
jgi:hypothetical protein